MDAPRGGEPSWGAAGGSTVEREERRGRQGRSTMERGEEGEAGRIHCRERRGGGGKWDESRG